MTNFRVICVNESNFQEYEVLEDKNVCTLDEVFTLVKENQKKYNNNDIRWILLQT